MRHPYTQGLFRSIPLPGADKTGAAAGPDPGQLPPAPRAPARLQLRAALRLLRRRAAATPATIPMVPVTPTPRAPAASAGDEIDWDAPPPTAARRAQAAPSARSCSSVENLRKYYEVGSNALFGGDTRVVKANESLSFEAREAETLAIVGEIAAAASRRSPRCCSGSRPPPTARSASATLEIGDLPIEQRSTRTVASIQMVFQNPFDTLNPSHSIGGQIVRVLEKFRIGDQRRRARGRGCSSSSTS